MSFKVKHWQDLGNLIAGVWMIVSTLVLAYHVQPRPMGNAVVLGVVIAAVALSALWQTFAWQGWANMLLGAWLIVSPWALGFSALQAAMVNALVVGVIVAALAIWVLASDRDIRGWIKAAH